METLIVLWLLFFISHSALATTKAKAFFQDKLKNNFKHYRLIYNGISAFFLLWIVYELFYTVQDFFFDPSLITFVLGIMIAMAGFLVLQATAKNYNLRAFFGLDTAGEESQGLNTEGIYQLVRHPLYFGIFLLFMGLFWIIPSEQIAFSVVMSILYIGVGIEFEEKKLQNLYGQAYQDYAEGKKKFIPFIY
jgi:methanethiol S-methyltransferase